MYENYLGNFKDSDYVTLMQSCLGMYATKGHVPDKVLCYVCGLYDTKITEGKVEDLKQKQLKMIPKSRKGR